MASAEMPGASNQDATPASKKQNHLVAGRRKLDAYRKKKAEEKRVGDKNTSAEKPIANDVHAEGILANGSDFGPSIEGNCKENHKVLHSNVGVNGMGAWSVGGLNEGKSNGLPETLWLERASGSEPYKTKSSSRGSGQGLDPFPENIPAPATTAVTLLEGDLAVKIPEYSDSKSSTSKTVFQNFAGLAGSVHEQLRESQQIENRSDSRALENDLVSTAPANHDSISSKHQESARVVSDGSLPSRIMDHSLQRPSGALFGLRTGSLQDFSLAFPASKQQTDTPALNLSSSIKDVRAGNGREELAPHFRPSVTSNGMKPRDSKEPQFLFAQTKKLPSSDPGERETLFSTRLLDKASFQPSSGLVPANPTALAISDYKEGSLSPSASEGSLSVSASASAHAFREQEKELKLVNQNKGVQKRAENNDFIALEQHIDELTQEKYALQRALDGARSLAESLSQQNSVLTEDFNSQGAIINQLQADMEKKKEEVTSQSLVLSSLMMERERAQQENNSAVERSQILAGEVIGLEEKVLKLRSNELKLQRELETLKSDNDSFRVHLGTLEKDRQNMRSMLEALQEDKKLLQVQLQKMFVSNDGMSNPKEVPQVDSRDASTSTDDLGVQTQNTQTAWPLVQRHVSHPQSNKNLDYAGDTSSSSILGSSPCSTGIGVPSTFATLSADDFRAINSIDGLITELLSEKGALLQSLERESAKASELQALNLELSKKLETQTQRLELVVAQNMAHGANAVATNSIEIEPEYNNYVDEGDEVVERVLGWIVRLFPGGSSRRQSSKLL